MAGLPRGSRRPSSLGIAGCPGFVVLEIPTLELFSGFLLSFFLHTDGIMSGFTGTWSSDTFLITHTHAHQTPPHRVTVMAQSEHPRLQHCSSNLHISKGDLTVSHREPSSMETHSVPQLTSSFLTHPVAS